MNAAAGKAGSIEEALDAAPQTLAELFTRAAAEHGRDDALSYKRDGDWLTISSSGLIERSQNIALGLYSLGLRHGDRVAILAANSPEWTLADAGCQFAGLIDVPIYTTLAPEAVRFILDDSGARVLFLENAAAYELVAPCLATCTTIERIVFFDAQYVHLANAAALTDLESVGAQLKQERPRLIDELTDAVKSEDIATLIYTSGTTGEPKGVMLSHRNLISNVVAAAEKFSFTEHDVSLSVLPLSHVFERTGMYVYLMYGIAVNYAESIEKVPENLKEVRPTIFIGVPRIFEKVYEKARMTALQSSPIRERIFDWAIGVAKKHALAVEQGRNISPRLRVSHMLAHKLVYSKLRDFFGGRLRFCITGGAALSDEIWLIFTGCGIRIMQGYGLTETSPVISSNNPDNIRLATVGKPIRGTTVRIAADGEVEVTGPGVMHGYYHKREATSEAFTEDGWFRTGDIGEMDAEGFLRITDRKKELFKTSGGKYIAPSPIEQMIKASRFVNQVVLVGNERKFPAALIVPNFEMLASYAKAKHLDPKTPAEFCASERILDLLMRQIDAVTSSLSHYEKVKKIVLLENELTVEGGELTPTLKVKRRVVEKKYRALIDAIYSET